MINKSLKEISWQVTEEEYRKDPAFSYSILAKFAREGFEHLDTLFDRVESPSLLFGSCVDTLLTDGDKAFEEQYFVSDIPSLKPSVEPVVKEVFNRFHNSYTNINDILDSDLMPIIAEYKYQPNWKNETRCKSIKQEGQQYYQTMFMAGNKTVVPQDMYNKIFACVRALKDSDQTRQYFADNDPLSSVERLYQLKFRGTLDGIDYRCMADLLVVDHKGKNVMPCDLKTSSHREYDFPESFLKFRYDIQARLYWRLIRKTMDEDAYFKNFELWPYRFIVVNNIDNPVPLVWNFRQTQAIGSITVGKQRLNDPQEIGKELKYYLDEKPQVPLGITLDQSNNIEKWFEYR